LVFFDILPTNQEGGSDFIVSDIGIMAGRNIIGSKFIGHLEKASKFHSFITPNAGIRRGSLDITPNEVLNDSLLKTFSGIDDLVRDP
jgi:hypothetical protein